jgi:diaminohydroxyphosphoribosylaminopyrimidine deaminase/5-amino-6-(5-phosphoribosylamino)uracil reductase
MTDRSSFDVWHMQRALHLAARGRGSVEPNPMVGCVIAKGAEVIGEGWHHKFGDPHAEIEALKIAGPRAEGATMYVTLEPCCHHGKTPPCTEAILDAKIGRVVAAMRDPFPEVDGGGISELRDFGVEVEVGTLEGDARTLNAPYLKLLETGRPWVIAKWAMTLDGKIATRAGASQWISNNESLEIVHAIRGRVDAILVGRQTAKLDNPSLTARPPGPRTALRIVADTYASLSVDSQLVCTARDVPVLVAVGSAVTTSGRRRLEEHGCEVFVCEGNTPAERLDALLKELGRRRLTNVLVEGGARLFGSLLDARQIDEVHVFLAPRLVGGAGAPSPVGGEGVEQMSQALLLHTPEFQQIGSDIYLHGCVRR